MKPRPVWEAKRFTKRARLAVVAQVKECYEAGWKRDNIRFWLSAFFPNLPLRKLAAAGRHVYDHFAKQARA